MIKNSRENLEFKNEINSNLNVSINEANCKSLKSIPKSNFHTFLQPGFSNEPRNESPLIKMLNKQPLANIKEKKSEDSKNDSSESNKDCVIYLTPNAINGPKNRMIIESSNLENKSDSDLNEFDASAYKRYREIVRNENYQSSNIRRIDSPLKAPRNYKSNFEEIQNLYVQAENIEEYSSESEEDESEDSSNSNNDHLPYYHVIAGTQCLLSRKKINIEDHLYATYEKYNENYVKPSNESSRSENGASDLEDKSPDFYSNLNILNLNDPQIMINQNTLKFLIVSVLSCLSLCNGRNLITGIIFCKKKSIY